MNLGPADLPLSPCISECCLDTHQICAGCFRSLDEICRWSESDGQARREILQQCHARRLASEQAAAVQSAR